MSKEGWEHTGRRIEDEATVEAPPEIVWDAWTDPDELARWFVDSASGTAEPGQEMTWAWEAYDLEQTLTVVEAERGKRLVLEVAWGDGRPTLIEVTVHPEGDSTRLRLVHSGFDEAADWDGEYEGARSGWTNALAHLKVYIEHHRGKDKQSLDLVRPATYQPEHLQELTRTPAGVARWLGTTEDEMSEVGDRIQLDLQDGSELTGTVIARTGWETAVTWEELDGVLTFQAFPGDPQDEIGTRMLGIRVVSWADPRHLEARRPGLEGALDRLGQALAG